MKDAEVRPLTLCCLYGYIRHVCAGPVIEPNDTVILDHTIYIQNMTTEFHYQKGHLQYVHSFNVIEIRGNGDNYL